MNISNVLDFLKRNQPLPDDNQLDSVIIRKYDEIRKCFMNNPDPEILELIWKRKWVWCISIS